MKIFLKFSVFITTVIIGTVILLSLKKFTYIDDMVIGIIVGGISVVIGLLGLGFINENY